MTFQNQFTLASMHSCTACMYCPCNVRFQQWQAILIAAVFGSLPSCRIANSLCTEYIGVCHESGFAFMYALRRPVNQGARYGEWFDGDDSALDKHLSEYNAQQAHAAQTTEVADRRRSAQPSLYAPDAETSDDDGMAHTNMPRHVRRSTIAPGQVICCIACLYVLKLQWTTACGIVR